MKKSQITVLPQFFDRYINIAEDIELIEGLEKAAPLFDLEKESLKRVADKRYASGKWTPKDIIQHVMDNERIQSYRAMRIARNDKTVLPGYDEELLAKHTNAGDQTIDGLLEEFKLLRLSNILMFKNFTDEMLQRSGTCYQVNISALALGFVLIGHQIHHLNVLKERYFNL